MRSNMNGRNCVKYEIEPCPKPRMTRRDKWQKRNCVLRYRAFCDHARLLRISVPPAGGCITFVLPMPKSWSQKKKDAHNGQPHMQKPDVDNLLKALLDAMFTDDKHINDVRVKKVWGEKGAIEVLLP